MTESQNWAPYQTIVKFAKGEQLESPVGNPYRYLAGRSGGKKKGLLGDFFPPSERSDPLEAGYINLNRVPPEGGEVPIGEYVKNSDWKIHISVHPDDVPLAWDSVNTYLQQENISAAKIANAKTAEGHADPMHHESGKKNPQLGKMMVLYVDDTIGSKVVHTDKDWQRILNGVEQRLAKAGVRPGEAVATDKAVEGSMYSYYRSDQITMLMDKAYAGIKEQNELIHIGELMESEKKRLGPDFSKTEKFGTPEEQAFNAAVLDIMENAPPREKVAVAREDMLDFLQSNMYEAISGFKKAELEVLIPDMNADLKWSRLKLLDLPPEQRYKLPIENDRLAGLHIEQPNILRAVQEKAVKDRGINTVA